VWEIL